MADRRQTFTISNSKKAVMRDFQNTIAGWKGMITAVDPLEVQDEYSIWIEGLPKVSGALVTPPAPSLAFNHTSTIVQFCYFALGSGSYFAILDSKNVLNFYTPTGSLITTYSSFGSNFVWCLQGNKYAYFGNSSHLIAFSGTTVYDLTSGNIYGNAMCYWKGRLFVAMGTVLNYSVISCDPTAGASAFWNTANGSGNIDLSTISSFVTITALDPKVDTIYAYTNNSIIAMIGTTTTNSPSLWYFQELIKNMGVSNQNYLKTAENTTYFCSIGSNLEQQGVQAMTSSMPQKIDIAISNIPLQSYVDYFVFNGLEYIGFIGQSLYSNSNVIYCYSTVFQNWFVLNLGFNVTDISTYQSSTYISSGTSIYLLFGGNSYLPINVVTKKIDLGQIIVNKNVSKMYLKGVGDSNYTCYLNTNSQTNIQFQQPKPLSLSYNYTFAINNQPVTLQNSSGTFSFIVTPQVSSGVATSVEFFNKYYLPNGLAIPSTWYQLQVKNTTNNYSELISCVVGGWIGRNY
jgi:hypothetical protein